jgi:ADP-ribose pyrophosphatase YjhB (NUDIX family)
MIRRGKPPREGQWSLPGGGQKLGETAFAAARREVQEETGLAVEVLGLVDVVDSIRRDTDGRVQYHYTLVDVLAVVAPGASSQPAAGGDAAEAAWFGFDDLAGLDLWSETKRIIDLAREMRQALADADG